MARSLISNATKPLAPTVHIEVKALPKEIGKPETTVYRIHNPLSKRHWDKILRDLRGHMEVELDAWRDAWLRKLLPEWAYKAAHSGNQAQARKCWEYMEKERIELLHPDGLSFERLIMVKGQPVARFEIEFFKT